MEKEAQTVYRRILAGEDAWYFLGPRCLWRVTGADRGRFLHGQLTQDILGQPVGRAIYSLALTPKGRLQAECTVFIGNEELWVETLTELKETLALRWQKFAIADDVAFEDVSQEWTLVHWFGFRPPPLPKGSMVWESRRLGLPGWDLCIPIASGKEIAFSSPQVPESLWETLRLEMGIGRWGRELHSDVLPQEARLERYAVSFEKGCYVGQEVVSRLAYVGHVNRILCLLAGPERELPLQAPAELLLEEGGSCPMTSTAYSLALDQAIALAYLPRAKANIGRRYDSPTGQWEVIDFPLQPIPFSK
jgi:folate-binding protein YgfZ